MSGPEVWKIFKIRTVRTLDVFLTGRQTLNTLKELCDNLDLCLQDCNDTRVLCTMDLTI